MTLFEILSVAIAVAALCISGWALVRANKANRLAAEANRIQRDIEGGQKEKRDRLRSGLTEIMESYGRQYHLLSQSSYSEPSTVIEAVENLNTPTAGRVRELKQVSASVRDAAVRDAVDAALGAAISCGMEISASTAALENILHADSLNRDAPMVRYGESRQRAQNRVDACRGTINAAIEVIDRSDRGESDEQEEPRRWWQSPWTNRNNSEVEK